MLFSHSRPQIGKFSPAKRGIFLRRWAIPLTGFLLAAAGLPVDHRGQAEIIVSCGFENAGDTWAFAPCGGTVNTDLGLGDFPPGQRIFAGSRSWLVNNTASTLTFAEVLLSGWTNFEVKYRVSSTASCNVGNDHSDQVAAYVATTSYANQLKADFHNLQPSAVLTGTDDGSPWDTTTLSPRRSFMPMHGPKCERSL